MSHISSSRGIEKGDFTVDSRIGNECIHKKFEVASIEDKMRGIG